ncbi:MAG: hypothetical protein JWO69_1689 [Thermoleophilia bacterium]|nr:hypothetical protein [Thermoleophilia bacterium]
MPLNLFGSVRATALVALVGASFASPILVKSDALASVGKTLGGDAKAAEVVEELVAGGFAFAMPADWGKLGASATTAPHDTNSSPDAGAVVSAVCPAGSTGAACKDGVRITFITYKGHHAEEGAEPGHGAEAEGLPVLTSLEEVFDARFRGEFSTFTKGEVKLLPSADGTQWLRYGFSHKVEGAVQQQVVAAYRSDDGGSVIAVATGPTKAMTKHGGEIDRFLGSAHELVEPAAH